MATREALKSPNSARPSAVGSPVPGQDMAAAAKAFMEQESQAASPAGGTLSEAAQNFVNNDSQVSAEATPPPSGGFAPDEFAPQPSFAEANMQQTPENIVTRIQAGLAANDEEKLNFLKRKFGDRNATMKDGKIYFRKAAGEKLHPLDPDTLELINDILPDFGREIVTEAAMLPGEVAGAGAGFFAGVEGGLPVTVPAGIMAGRVASVPMANAAADWVAQKAGVPQDTSRNKLAENAIGMGAELALPFIGGKVAKYIPGTTAYKMAKEAGERETVALTRQSREIMQNVMELGAEGRAYRLNGAQIGLPGADVNLMGHQINPENPILKRLGIKAASDPRYINAETQLAEGWGDSLRNTLQEIARRGNPGPYRPETLASRVTNAVADLQRSEGKDIQQFTSKAMAKLKNEKQDVPPQLRQKVEGLLREFNFRPRTKEATVQTRIGGLTPEGMLPRGRRTTNIQETIWDKPKDIRSLVGKLGLKSEGEVLALVNNLHDLSKGMDTGMRMSEIDRLRNAVGTAGDSLYNTQAGAKLSNLAGDLRQFFRDTVGKGLDGDFEKAAFNSTMDDYHALKTSVDTLKNALNEDASRVAIVKNIFTGKDNLEKIQAIKKLSPESFSALKEEWINQRLLEFGSRKNRTGLKSTQFLDALNEKYGDDFLKEVLNDGPGPNADTVKKILTVTERIEQMSRGMPADQMSEARKKAIADAGIGLFANIKFKAVNGLTSLFTKMGGGNSALMDIMTRDGIDKYIAKYPGKIDKKTVLMRMNDALGQYRTMKLLESGDVGGRAMRATVKQKAQE